MHCIFNSVLQQNKEIKEIFDCGSQTWKNKLASLEAVLVSKDTNIINDWAHGVKCRAISVARQIWLKKKNVPVVYTFIKIKIFSFLFQIICPSAMV